MTDTDPREATLGRRIHHLKRRIVLIYPRRVTFRVGSHDFTIYGTWSRNHGLGHDFARNQCHEPMLSRLLIDALVEKGPDAVYWDVGSAIGYFVAIAGRIVEPDRVHAFEPGPNFAYLQYNNRKLFGGRVFATRAFLTNHSARSSTTADEYARVHGDPSVLKIDVDGAEAEVIAGGMNMLRRALPMLFLEVHFVGGPEYPNLRSRLIGLLQDLPYRYELCRNHRRPDGELEPLESIESLPSRRDSSFDDNDYLLVARPGA